MKWVFLALMIAAATAISGWLRSKPKNAPVVWGLLGFLPFVLSPWHLIVAPYSTPLWPGFVKGWEFSALDAVAIAILVGTRVKSPRLIFAIPFFIYLGAVAIAVFQAKFGKLALAYVIQLVRIFIVYIAVSRVVTSDRGERAVLVGLVLGLSVQAGYAIWARAGGALQTGGSLGHQNLLGFMSHMVLLPSFALFLSGRSQRIALLGVIAGLTVVILTASRATIAFSAIGLVLTMIMSMGMKFTGRKALYAAVGIVLLGASYPLARASLDRRFEVQKLEFFDENQERDAFMKAARAMLSDNPMGVGPNHYVYVANMEGYSARAGVAWQATSRGTSVHNSFMLALVETGYLGLITLLVLLASAIWYAFATCFRFRDRPGAELLIGVGCAIVAICLHGLYEWMFLVFPTQYLFGISLGLITGVRSRFLESSVKRLREQRLTSQAVGVV